MGLDTILKAIQTAGESQIKGIDLDQKRKTTEVLAQAIKTSQKLEKREFDTQILKAREQEALILQDAGLKAARIKDQAVNNYLQQIWDQVEKNLAGIRLQKEYPEILKSLVKEVYFEFEQTIIKDKKLLFKCDPRDRSVLEKIFPELKIQPEISFTLNSWGGVILYNQSGSLKLDNTLEARLYQSRDILNRVFLKNLHLAAGQKKTPNTV